jgi:hypothetical protein
MVYVRLVVTLFFLQCNYLFSNLAPPILVLGCFRDILNDDSLAINLVLGIEHHAVVYSYSVSYTQKLLIHTKIVRYPMSFLGAFSDGHDPSGNIRLIAQVQYVCDISIILE